MTYYLFTHNQCTKLKLFKVRKSIKFFAQNFLLIKHMVTQIYEAIHRKYFIYKEFNKFNLSNNRKIFHPECITRITLTYDWCNIDKKCRYIFAAIKWWNPKNLISIKYSTHLDRRYYQKRWNQHLKCIHKSRLHSSEKKYQFRKLPKGWMKVGQRSMRPLFI